MILTPYLQIYNFHWNFKEIEEREEISSAHVHIENNRLSSELCVTKICYEQFFSIVQKLS